MQNFGSYKDLQVWQKSILLAKEVYVLVDSLPSSERYNLSDQLKRAVISISSNIAEGWGRETPQSFISFLRIAKGSLYEVESQLIVGKELNYLKDIELSIKLIQEINKMLNGLMRSIKAQNAMVK